MTVSSSPSVGITSVVLHVAVRCLAVAACVVKL